MNPVIEEVALRAYHFSATRLLAISNKDKENSEEELPKEERQLLDFISRWHAGSLFIDLFTGPSIRRLVEEVFDSVAIQTFVFDLRFQAMVGIDSADAEAMITNMANVIAPGFVAPKADNYGKLTPMKQALAEFDFADDKWKTTKEDIVEMLRFMPWVVPLLLISIGALIHGTNPNPDTAG